jgi:hypothetical protein
MGVLEYWGKEKKRLTQIENVKCQSSNAKSNPNVK